MPMATNAPCPVSQPVCGQRDDVPALERIRNQARELNGYASDVRCALDEARLRAFGGDTGPSTAFPPEEDKNEGSVRTTLDALNRVDAVLRDVHEFLNSI